MGQVIEKNELRNLCRFARACFTNEYKELVRFVEFEKLFALQMYGEIAPCFEDLEVLARQRQAGKRIVGPIFSLSRLLCSGVVAFEAGQW